MVKVLEPTPVTGPRIGVYSVSPFSIGGCGIELKLAVFAPRADTVLDAVQPPLKPSRQATKKGTNQLPKRGARVFKCRS